MSATSAGVTAQASRGDGHTRRPVWPGRVVWATRGKCHQAHEDAILTAVGRGVAVGEGVRVRGHARAILSEMTVSS